jgi:hypothetical protein
MQGRFQLMTGGFASYPDTAAYSLLTRVDFVQLVKIYEHPCNEQGRYSPPTSGGNNI